MRVGRILGAAALASASLFVATTAAHAAEIAESSIYDAPGNNTQYFSYNAGTNTLTGAGVVTFDFLQQAIPGFDPLQANFSFNASTGQAGSSTTQGGLGGTFSFTSASAFTFNGVNYAANTNLLSGTFTGADLIVPNSTIGAFLSTNSATYTSSLLDFSASTGNVFSFSFSGLEYPNGDLTSEIPTFTATGNGSFDSTGFTVVNSPIPEPATWAVMILGFGMMGAALRRRHAMGALA